MTPRPQPSPGATRWPTVRVEEGALGPDSQVRLVVSGVPEDFLYPFQRAWASAGAALERSGLRLRATSTVSALSRASQRSLPPVVAQRLEESLRSTVDAWFGAPSPVPLPGGRLLATDLRPLVMGVVNVTDDSFSDGGLLYPEGHPQRGIAHARALVAEGADVLDIGGESTRPGAEPVRAGEERKRVLPVLEALTAEGAICSVDTRKPSVARPAIGAGAAIVNDVGGASDPELLEAVAASDAAYVLMHTRGTPADMQRRTDYTDVVAEVYEFLAEGLRRCAEVGLPPERVMVDPGIGFAKTSEQNLALLRALDQFRGLGRPVLVGVSRKSFLGPLSGPVGPWSGGATAATGQDADPAGAAAPDLAADRREGSLAAATLGVTCGAAVLRVHDVRATVRAARVARAVDTGQTDWPAPVRAPVTSG